MQENNSITLRSARGLAIVATGFVLAFLPHFLLPLSYLKGWAGARIVQVCSLEYHPELYLGFAVMVFGFLSLYRRRAAWGAVAMALAGLIHAFSLEPVQYYLLEQEHLQVFGQRLSLRSHGGIAYTLAVLSLAVLAASLWALKAPGVKQYGPMTLFGLARAGVQGRFYRSLSLSLVVALVVGAVFSFLLIGEGMHNTILGTAQRLDADLMAVPRDKKKDAEAVLHTGEPRSFYLSGDTVERLRRFPGIEGVSPHLYLQSLSYELEDAVENILIIAFDPATDFTVWPWVSYSLGENPLAGKDEVVVGKLVKFYPGQQIPLLGKKHQVGATLEPTGLGCLDKAAFIPLDRARQLLQEAKSKWKEEKKRPARKVPLALDFDHFASSSPQDAQQLDDVGADSVSAVFIKVQHTHRVSDVAEKIEKAFDDLGVIILSRQAAQVKGAILPVMQAFLLPAALLLAMGVAILTAAFTMIVNERMREIGLLRAMGATKGQVFRIFIIEALMVSLWGGVAGILTGATLLFFFKNMIMAALDLFYVWPPLPQMLLILGLTLVAALCTGVTASLYPALKASTMEPATAVKAGG